MGLFETCYLIVHRSDLKRPFTAQLQLAVDSPNVVLYQTQSGQYEAKLMHNNGKPINDAPLYYHYEILDRGRKSTQVTQASSLDRDSHNTKKFLEANISGEESLLKFFGWNKEDHGGFTAAIEGGIKTTYSFSCSSQF